MGWKGCIPNRVKVLQEVSSMQSYFFVFRAEVFHGIPDKNRDFSNQFFCPGYISLVNIVALPFYTTKFFVRAKKLCGASLHWYIPIAQRIVDAPLYRIPLGNFNCVLPGGSLGVVNELA